MTGRVYPEKLVTDMVGWKDCGGKIFEGRDQVEFVFDVLSARGYAIVPKIPTEHMGDQIMFFSGVDSIHTGTELWRAMVEAAQEDRD